MSAIHGAALVEVVQEWRTKAYACSWRAWNGFRGSRSDRYPSDVTGGAVDKLHAICMVR